MTDLQWFVTYDPVQDAWIGTGKTFTIGEQIDELAELADVINILKEG